MFDHLSYLLQNSSIGLGQCQLLLSLLFISLLLGRISLNDCTCLCPLSGMRGSTPLDVAAASCIDNNELALALQEQDLEMVCADSNFLQRCTCEFTCVLIPSRW